MKLQNKQKSGPKISAPIDPMKRRQSVKDIMFKTDHQQESGDGR
jgi:hypothetical protein